MMHDLALIGIGVALAVFVISVIAVACGMVGS